jgi:hypothetical protein
VNNYRTSQEAIRICKEQSSLFSKFVEQGIIEVKQRHVRILNADALKLIINNQACRITE